MKIALFCESYGRFPQGGPSVYGRNMVRMLERAGADFTLFHDGDVHSDWKTANMRSLSAFSPDYDVYYVMGGAQTVHMLNQRGIWPIIGSNIVPNSIPQHSFPYAAEVDMNRRQGYAASEAQHVRTLKGKFWLAQSRFQEREYRRLGMPWNVQVYLANNPVDTDLFTPAQREGDYILWVGKENTAKHPEWLVELAQAFPGEKFLAASDEHMPVLENAGLPNLKVTGATPLHMPDVFRRAKMYISTSITENQPLGCMEAMACGLPCLAFRTSGMPEIISEETGVLVDLGNLEHFRVELERLLRDELARRKLGNAGRQRAVEQWSYPQSWQLYSALFEKYVGN